MILIAGIGAAVGSLAGYFGGRVDNFLMRVVDVVLSLPYLILILLIVSFFGIRDIRVIVIAIAIAGWTTAARLVRAEFLHLREMDFVAAARALGASPRRMIVRHMLPGAMAPLVVACSLGVADAIIGESALSVLGFGIAPPEISLGQMLNGYREYFYDAPGADLLPGHHARRHRPVRQLPRRRPARCPRPPPASRKVTVTRATTDATGAPRGENLLEIHGLKTHFFTQDGTVKAVDGVTYEIKYGQTLGVVGESGCGKSISALSAMRLVERPGRTVAGEIRLDGRDLLKLSDEEMSEVRGNAVSMIFQEPMTSLNPGLHLRRPDRRGGRPAQEGIEAGGVGPGHRDAPPGGHRRRQAAGQELPAPAVGRHAPARDDRHGPLDATRSCSSPTSRRRRST